MSKVKFVSTALFKESTTVEMNVDDNKIVPLIYKVQDVYLQQILGTAFYNELKNGVISGSTNSDEETLIREYIQPYIIEMTLYEVIPFLNFKLTNKAVSSESSEFSQPTTLEEIKYLRSNVKDMAEFYGQRLQKHLCDYSSLFPTYISPGDKENLKKSGKSYFNGIYIPKNK